MLNQTNRLYTTSLDLKPVLRSLHPIQLPNPSARVPRPPSWQWAARGTSAALQDLTQQDPDRVTDRDGVAAQFATAAAPDRGISESSSEPADSLTPAERLKIFSFEVAQVDPVVLFCVVARCTKT